MFYLIYRFLFLLWCLTDTKKKNIFRNLLQEQIDSNRLKRKISMTKSKTATGLIISWSVSWSLLNLSEIVVYKNYRNLAWKKHTKVKSLIYRWSVFVLHKLLQMPFPCKSFSTPSTTVRLVEKLPPSSLMKHSPRGILSNFAHFKVSQHPPERPLGLWHQF